MSNVFDFEWDEMPLVIVDGIPAALINGMAAIKYDRHGHWTVSPEDIAVEGYQTLTTEERARGVRPWIYVSAPYDIGVLIAHRLEQEWFDKVQDAVNEHLATDREDAREAQHDARRDDAMWGGVL